MVAGKFVFEARPRGVEQGQRACRADGGAAVQGASARYSWVTMSPVRGRRIQAAQAQGGIGIIKVGEGASGARCQLENPVAVTAWLRNSLRQNGTITGNE